MKFKVHMALVFSIFSNAAIASDPAECERLAADLAESQMWEEWMELFEERKVDWARVLDGEELAAMERLEQARSDLVDPLRNAVQRSEDAEYVLKLCAREELGGRLD